MGGKSSAPPAPDYAAAAQQTAAGNLDNLKYQTQANRPDMVTPWGTSTWTQGTNADGTPNNQWSNNVALSPDQQAALDAQQKVQMNQSQLAQTLQSQVGSTMAGGFNAPQLSTYMSGVPGVNTNFAGFTPTGVGSVDQRSFNPMSYLGGVQGVNQNFSGGPSQNLDATGAVAGAGSVNQNAPQFSDANAAAGAKSAYEGATALLQDQWGQDAKRLDEQLRLQGLTPGSEAYNNAVQNQQRVQAQQQNQLANQAVVTGNSMANQNYASSLAGYNAGNQAQNQAYSQGANTFSLGNNAAATQFGQNAQAYGLTNDARTQALQNALGVYGAGLQGQSAYNTAQGQAYNQALAGYGANAGAQEASNAAQQQAYQQALQNYGTAYNSAYQNYLQPLNSMNAVLTGQQVQSPTFQGFSQAGYTPGADYSGAASSLGQWNSGVMAQDTANRSSTLGTIGTLGTAAALFFSDARLKKNIKLIGRTKGGNNWYAWDWKDGSGSSDGVIAQELAHTAPHAVHVDASGYLMVDYDMVH